MLESQYNNPGMKAWAQLHVDSQPIVGYNWNRELLRRQYFVCSPQEPECELNSFDQYVIMQHKACREKMQEKSDLDLPPAMTVLVLY